MTIEKYLQRKQELRKKVPSPRTYCSICKKTLSTCYCPAISPFEPLIQIVILIHPLEAKKPVATGRMAHLCLAKSNLIVGVDFSQDARVNALIENPSNYCAVLFPGKNSANLSTLPTPRDTCFPRDKNPVLFVIDGTWAQAKRMKRLSNNLSSLPCISFTPQTPSRFRVRKQPQSHYYSTVEAIHACLNLLEPNQSETHRHLLVAFDYMVEQQIQFEKTLGVHRKFRSTRGIRMPNS